MITSTKNYTEKNKKQKKQTDRNLGQLVKANLYRQNHSKKHTHTHSQIEIKRKYIYIYFFFLKKEESTQVNKQTYQ